jgi:predicted amidophosphoribosyltransferase
MALINCPECGKEVSDQSEVCIKCAFPLKKNHVKKDNVQSNTENELKKATVNSSCLEDFFHTEYKKVYDIEGEDTRNWFLAIFYCAWNFFIASITLVFIFVCILLGKKGKNIFNIYFKK